MSSWVLINYEDQICPLIQKESLHIHGIEDNFHSLTAKKTEMQTSTTSTRITKNMYCTHIARTHIDTFDLHHRAYLAETRSAIKFCIVAGAGKHPCRTSLTSVSTASVDTLKLPQFAVFHKSLTSSL